MNIIEKYKIYLDRGGYELEPDNLVKYFNPLPKLRYHTFKYCYDYFKNQKKIVIVELGTTRSFVCGRFEGCNSNDMKYWEPNNPEKWDWGAGCFTKVFSTLFPNSDFHTVDIISDHINRCKIMNSNNKNINYHVISSENFLENFNKKIDLLYLDTGDMTPIEPTAQLHLREAKIIVEKDLVAKDGLILIDDVKSPLPKMFGEKSDLGKAKYSIPYFLENGFELIIDEYQTILKKID